jgi:hypothetical protein
MSKSEVIAAVGAEGGSIALHGVQAPRSWIFAIEVNDGTPELLGEEPTQTKSAAVETWDAALDLLDRYRWASLLPLFVHPDFRRQIWDAVQERLETETSQSALNQWREICPLE